MTGPYNTTPNLKLKCNVEYDEVKEALLLLFQIDAYAMIDAFNANATDALAASIEVDLVRRMISNYHAEQNPKSSDYFSPIPRPVELTPSQKRQLFAGVLKDIPVDGPYSGDKY